MFTIRVELESFKQIQYLEWLLVLTEVGPKLWSECFLALLERGDLFAGCDIILQVVVLSHHRRQVI